MNIDQAILTFDEAEVPPPTRQTLVEAGEVLVSEIERLQRHYKLFEEMSPPDVPRPQFVRWCFDAWEKAAEAGGE